MLPLRWNGGIMVVTLPFAYPQPRLSSTPEQDSMKAVALLMLLLICAPLEMRAQSPAVPADTAARLSELLRSPETIRLEDALSMIRQRELNPEASIRNYGDLTRLMSVINRRWPHDPTVLEFFREALATRGPEAINDLYSPVGGIWDDSLVGPILGAVEAVVQPQSRQPLAGALRANSMLARVLSLLERHVEVWKDPTVSLRLSKAVLTANPLLVDPPADPSLLLSAEVPFNEALKRLGQTHDRAMIPVLRPFLRVNALFPGDAIRSAARICDLARDSIYVLLGETQSVDRVEYNFSVSADPRIWMEWDRKNVELENRLAAMFGR